ncbi:hypothetical protein CR513_05647, partial [Mucuna pruriens]
MEWTQERQEAFEKVKQYLESPLVLAPAVLDKPLILYLTVLKEAMGGILGQRDDSGKELWTQGPFGCMITHFQSAFGRLLSPLDIAPIRTFLLDNGAFDMLSGPLGPF